VGFFSEVDSGDLIQSRSHFDPRQRTSRELHDMQRVNAGVRL